MGSCLISLDCVRLDCSHWSLLYRDQGSVQSIKWHACQRTTFVNSLTGIVLLVEFCLSDILWIYITWGMLVSPVMMMMMTNLLCSHARWAMSDMGLARY